MAVEQFTCTQCSTIFSRRGDRANPFCSHSCATIYSNKHRNLTPKYIKECPACGVKFNRQKKTAKFCSLKCAFVMAPDVMKTKYGKLNQNWRGGVTSENERIRKSQAYKNWRISVFERDKYSCQHCGQVGGKLNADHIKPFALFPELRLDLSNGQTLCYDCHRLTSTWGSVRIKATA